MESWKRSKIAFAGLAITPLFWMVFFVFIPLGFLLLFSFEREGLPGFFLDSYKKLADPIYIAVFGRSLLFAIETTAISFVVGFPVALFVAFSSPKVRQWAIIFFILPFWTSALVRVYAIMGMLGAMGYLNEGLRFLESLLYTILAFFGVSAAANFVFVPHAVLYSNAAVIGGLVYISLPFMIFPIYAGLLKLDRSQIEASLDLGAGHRKTFQYIVLPLLFPSISAAWLLTFIPALGAYLIPEFMGGISSQMIASVITEQFKTANNWALGSAASVAMLILVGLMVLSYIIVAKISFRLLGYSTEGLS